jgi:hypothetical protein
MEPMTAGKFRHLPIVVEGLLVGILSIGDVVKHRVQEIESCETTSAPYRASSLRRGSDHADAPIRTSCSPRAPCPRRA